MNQEYIWKAGDRLKIRDKETFILFIAGTSLSFFIVINGIQLMNGWLNQIRHGQEEEGYKSAVEFEVMTMEEDDPRWDESYTKTDEDTLLYQEKADRLWELLEAQEENVYFRTSVDVGREAASEQVDIVLSGTEGWYRTLRSGQYQEGVKLRESGGCVYLSEAAEQMYAEWIDGQEVIRADGRIYPVMGIFEDYRMSDQLSGENIEICFYYIPQAGDPVYDRLGSMFPFGRVTIGMGSDREDVTEAADALMAEIEAELGYFTAVEENPDDGMSGGEQFYAKMKSIVLLLLFLISLLNCRQITALWIRRRQKELVICKTFGMNDRQLLLRVLRELLGMLGISMAVVPGIHGIDLLLSGNGMDLQLALQDSALLLGAFLIIMAVAVLPVLNRIRSIVPAQGLRGE